MTTRERLAIDLEPAAYLDLHGRVDEPVADAMLEPREREVRASARDVAAHVLAPAADEIDRRHTFVHDGYRALVSAGLGGLLFAKDLGGTEDSHVAYAVAMEEIAAGCAATSLVFMTQMHAAYPIALAGTDELCHSIVPRLLSGEVYGSLAITEPDAGSDVSAIRTSAALVGDEYELNGSKTFITTGDKAGVIVCFASTDRSLGRDGITALVLQSEWPGVSAGAPLRKMGMHGSSTAELFFDRVAVPVGHRLGAEGAAWSVVMGSVVKSRISAAAQGVGIARSAYARTLAALAQIHGPRLPTDVLARLAELRGALLEGTLLVRSVARRVDATGTASTGEIGIMKQRCTELAYAVAREGVRLLGPVGDLRSLGVERAWRDSLVTQIYDGTNDIQRLLIGREISDIVGGLTSSNASQGAES